MTGKPALKYSTVAEWTAAMQAERDRQRALTEKKTRDWLFIASPEKSSLKALAHAIATKHGITVPELRNPQRANRKYSTARAEFVKVVWDANLDISMKRLGLFLNYCDHSTIVHILRKQKRL